MLLLPTYSLTYLPILMNTTAAKEEERRGTHSLRKIVYTMRAGTGTRCAFLWDLHYRGHNKSWIWDWAAVRVCECFQNCWNLPGAEFDRHEWTWDMAPELRKHAGTTSARLNHCLTLQILRSTKGSIIKLALLIMHHDLLYTHSAMPTKDRDMPMAVSTFQISTHGVTLLRSSTYLDR